MVFISAQLIHNEEQESGGRFGSKILSLRDLLHLGLPVPRFFALSTKCSERLAGLPKEERQSFIRGELGKVHSALGARSYAIRSAALSEDGSESSRAGCFHSATAIAPESLVSAFEEVLLHPKNIQAVCEGQFSIFIQEYCEADFSGVCFTRDPRGLRNMVVEFVSGPCARLVSGEAIPEKLRSFHGGPYPRTPGKDFTELWALVERIEALLHYPQDIEWCFANACFWILQSRPVSTISSSRAQALMQIDKDRRLQGRRVVFQKTGISEIAPRPCPLTFSLFEQLYAQEGAVDQAYKSFGLGYQERPQLELFLGELFVNKAEELKTLFPAWEIGENGKERFRLLSPKAAIRTWKNSRRFRNIRFTDLEQARKHIQQLLEKRFSALAGSEDSLSEIIRQFFLDYREIFRINLAAETSCKRLEAGLKVTASELLKHLPELLSIDEGGEISSQLTEEDIRRQNIIGNSLDFLDTSDFSFRSKEKTKALTDIPSFGTLPEWKKAYLRPQIMEAAALAHLREMGRGLAVIGKERIRRGASLMLAREGCAERLLPFFTIAELQEESLPSERARARAEEWNSRPPSELPEMLSNILFDDVTSKAFGVSSGQARGILLDETRFLMVGNGEKAILFVSSLSPELIKYFPSLLGIVSSQGGILSHLAILARERGVPVIVEPEVSKILELLGKEVEIDGSLGTLSAV